MTVLVAVVLGVSVLAILAMAAAALLGQVYADDRLVDHLRDGGRPGDEPVAQALAAWRDGVRP